jgi:tRNA nucleotidyltransferase (CCA-adding enzyme)
MRDPKLIDKFLSLLPAPARHLLDEFLRIAEPHGVPLYLVGGPLRDLMLERPSLDIDIAVEGDAPALAHELAEASGGRAVIHPAFLTATVRIPGQAPRPGCHLDLITTRSETYARPGALPTVKPATIREDLLRRDFTINALALRLNGPARGELLDPVGGRRDLDARLVRVLHDRSLQDDATRILRAFRYATRLGFEIEPQTLAWLERDLRYLDTVSGARLHHEFARIFAEQTPEDIVLRLHQTGALCDIHPTLRFAREHAKAFARLRELHPSGARSAYWPVLAWQLTESEAASLARRLALTRTQRVAHEAMPPLQRLESPSVAQGPNLEPVSLKRNPPSVAQGPSPEPVSLGDPNLKRSALAELLAPFPLPTLWAFTALTDDPTVYDRLLDYLTTARNQRPLLTGDDLLAMGAPQGPQLGELLRRLRAAKLDGESSSLEDERRLARRLITEGDKAQHSEKKAAPSRSS